MNRMRKVLAAGVSLVVTFAAAVPAQALPIQSFFNDMTEDAQSEAVHLALTTEAYRKAKAGDTAFANCMEEDVISRDGRNVPGFAYLVRSLRDSKNKKTETVEEAVLATISRFCGPSPVETVSPSPLIFLLTPGKFFFANVPNTLDRIDVLRLALSTQALRVMNAGDEPRGQCIMNNLVKTTATPEGRTVYSQGLKGLAQALAVAAKFHDTESVEERSVEGKVMGAIVSQCGQEQELTPK
jgi:hypothetical protein